MAYWIIVLFIPVLVSAAPSRTVTLEDLKKYGLEKNFGLQRLDQEMKAAEYETQTVRSKFFPTLSLVAGTEMESIDTERDSTPVGYLHGKYNLFNGFKDYFEYQSTFAIQKMAESSRRKAERELELEIEGQFYKYIFLKKKIAHVENSLNYNSKHSGLIRKKQSSGMASQADAMEFELRDSFLSSTRTILKQELTEAQFSLVRLLGPDLGTDIEPSGELPHFHIEEDKTTYLKKLEDNSEAIKVSSWEYQSAVNSLKSARSTWIPSVDVEAKVGKVELDVGDSSQGFNDYRVGVTATWEFFSGFGGSGAVGAAGARAAAKDFALKEKIITTMTEVEIQFMRLMSIQERVHLEEKNEQRSERYYKSVYSEYTRGIKNGADLKAAEEMVLEAKTRADELKYEFIVGKLALEKSSGILIKTSAHKL